MAISSFFFNQKTAYEIDLSRHGRHGKTDIRRGSSVRSDGSVLTMLLSSASDISAICSIRTKNITTRLVRRMIKKFIRGQLCVPTTGSGAVGIRRPLTWPPDFRGFGAYCDNDR